MGSVPLINDQVYGPMPPDPANVVEYANCAVAAGRVVVVIAGAAGIVSVTEPDWVLSATEVAVRVTCCAEAVAAGAVYVGVKEVRLESVPIVGAVQVTPALLLSLATDAVTVTASFPSIDVDTTETETLGGGLIVRLSIADVVSAVGVPESVIWNVRFVAGVVVVAPAAAESTPVLAFRLMPTGSVPLSSFHV